MSAGDGTSGRDRLRYLLTENQGFVLAACLLLVLGGGYVAVQAHTGPDTTTEQRTTGRWTTNASVDHGAVVQQGSLAFAEGEVLQNRSGYFRGVTPVLNGSLTVGHDGSPADVRTTTDLRLVLQSVMGGDGGQVLWQRTEHLETVEATGTDTVRVPFEVNVSERIETAIRIRDSLGSSLGQTRLLLVAETRTEATVAGESRTQTRTDRLRIRPRTEYYEVVPTPAESQTETVSETVTVPVETDPVRAYGSLFVVLVGLVGGASVTWLDRTDRLAVSPSTVAAIERESERETFDEWISRGRVPPAESDERVIDVDSLEDLVDVAIDSDRRVIEDAESGSFVVFDGATRYRFRDSGGLKPTEVDEDRVATAGDASIEGTITDDGSDSADGGGDGTSADGEGSDR